MGCNIDCGPIGKTITEDFNFDDPHGKSFEEVNNIYDILKKKIDKIVSKHMT